MQLKFNSNPIEKKLDPYWRRRYWKFTLEYGVEKKDKDSKKNPSMPFYLGIWAKHILIWNCPNDDL